MAINLARPKIGHFVPVKSINIVKLIILHKYLTENWLFSGLKKPAGLPGFEDRASGGPGLRKIGRAGGFYRPGPWLVTSLLWKISYFYHAVLYLVITRPLFLD